MKLSTEDMRLYQRRRREKIRAQKAAEKAACPECESLKKQFAELQARNAELEQQISGMPSVKVTTMEYREPDLRTHHPACKCAICRPPK